MTRPEHWEPPTPRPLLVSARRVAAELDITQAAAWEVCVCLEKLYYGEGRTHYRVTRRSLDALKALMANGLDLYLARSVMARYVAHGVLPPPEVSRERARSIASRWVDWGSPPHDERTWVTDSSRRREQYRWRRS